MVKEKEKERGRESRRREYSLPGYSWDVVIHLTSHRSGNTLDVEMCKLQEPNASCRRVWIGRKSPREPPRQKRETTVIRRKRR